MASNPSSDNEKPTSMDPKDLRFTQLDIAPSFSNPAHPNVEEAISLIHRRQLDPAVFGDLTVHRDKEGVVWCEDNRRLYVLRKAGVESVSVKFKNNDYISRRTKEVKIRLNDPNFMPRIRSETSGVQIPPPSMTCGTSVVDQEQKGTSGVQIPPPPNCRTSVDQEQRWTSLLVFVGSVFAALVAVYWGWKLYADNEN